MDLFIVQDARSHYVTTKSTQLLQIILKHPHTTRQLFSVQNAETDSMQATTSAQGAETKYNNFKRSPLFLIDGKKQLCYNTLEQ